MPKRALTLVSAVLVLQSPVLAQAPAGDRVVPERLEVTMTLLPPHAGRPDLVTASIELPKQARRQFRASRRAVERSEHGIDTATRARELGRDFGEAMAAAARERREDLSRAGRDAALTQANEQLSPGRVAAGEQLAPAAAP